MQIKTERKTQPVTRVEALAALWRVKLRLGQHPIHIVWTQAERPPVPQERQRRIGT